MIQFKMGIGHRAAVLNSCCLCWERGDKSLMEEFFNQSEEIVQRLESKKSENAVHMQSEQKVGRPPGRLICTTWCTAAVRSTEQSTVCTTQFMLKVDRRSVDRLARAQFLLGFGRPTGRPKEGSVDHGAVDRQSDLLVLSEFELHF